MLTAGPLHHVAISVSDLNRSIRFYQDVLGYVTTLDNELAVF